MVSPNDCVRRLYEGVKSTMEIGMEGSYCFVLANIDCTAQYTCYIIEDTKLYMYCTGTRSTCTVYRYIL